MHSFSLGLSVSLSTWITSHFAFPFSSTFSVDPGDSSFRPYTQRAQMGLLYLPKIYGVTSLCQRLFTHISLPHSLSEVWLALSTSCFAVWDSKRHTIEYLSNKGKRLESTRMWGKMGDIVLKWLMNVFTWVAKIGKEDGWTLDGMS